MTNLDLIAAAYWPTIGGLILASVILRRFPSISVPAVTTATTFAVAGFFVAAFAELGSLWIMLDAQIGLILFGFASLAIAYLGGRDLSRNWRLRLLFPCCSGLPASAQARRC
jgi:hypothetical protein